MVKGSVMQVVRLQKKDSRYFEEVLFVLRDGCDRGAPSADIVAEATRILEESVQGKEARGDRSASWLVPFLLGALAALAVCLPLLL